MENELFELIDREYLNDVLSAFSKSLSLPVSISDAYGKVIESVGGHAGACALIGKKVLSVGECERVRIDAGKRAHTLGEPYIFSCPANLTCIAFPLSKGNTLYGAVIAGPFLMDAPDSTIVQDIAQRRGLAPDVQLDVYDELARVDIIKPARVRDISKLMHYLLSGLIPAEREKRLKDSEKLYQQARIGESIQMFKMQNAPENTSYSYEMERSLLTKVRTGDISAAKGILNDLLGYVFFCEGGKLETMKYRAIELATLLSRVSIEGGALTDLVFRINNQFTLELAKIASLEELCYSMQNIVEAFMEATFNTIDTAGQETIRRAVNFMARKFAEPITLSDVAKHVNLSNGYFSGLFKRVTGVGFREYLNQVRVEEAKRLLAVTDYPTVDIAIATGFSDQSYFSKVFKRYTGVTPKQYR